jgi:hypothetical protein
MLEAAEARKLSALFNRPEEWNGFTHWCQDSPEASRVLSRAEDGIETFCLDRDAQLYCIAMSLETLEGIIKALVEAYEDQALEKILT